MLYNFPEWAVDHFRRSFPAVRVPIDEELEDEAFASVNSLSLSHEIEDDAPLGNDAPRMLVRSLVPLREIRAAGSA